MFTPADWVIAGIVLLSGIISVFRGFIKEAVSLIGWVCAFTVTSNFYDKLATKLTFFEDNLVRLTVSSVFLFIATMFVVALCGSILSGIVHKSGLSGTDRFLGMIFGILRGVLIICVLLVLLQIGFKLHILSFVEDAPFFRDSVLIPELQRIVDWFFDNTPINEQNFGVKQGA